MDVNKDILLEKMLDPDSTLTDAELELILADDELREIHEISAAVMGASIQPTEVDIEKEWRLFRHKLHPRPSLWRRAMRVAAIFLGVLFVSAILKLGIDRILTDDDPVTVAETKPSEYSAPSETVTAPMPLQKVEEKRIAVHEKVKTPRKKRQKPSIPVLTEEEEMKVDEFLRLQQARIDNDLAMMQAELYVEELQALDYSDPSASIPVQTEYPQPRILTMP